MSRAARTGFTAALLVAACLATPAMADDLGTCACPKSFICDGQKQTSITVEDRTPCTLRGELTAKCSDGEPALVSPRPSVAIKIDAGAPQTSGEIVERAVRVASRVFSEVVQQAATAQPQQVEAVACTSQVAASQTSEGDSQQCPYCRAQAQQRAPCQRTARTAAVERCRCTQQAGSCCCEGECRCAADETADEVEAVIVDDSARRCRCTQQAGSCCCDGTCRCAADEAVVDDVAELMESLGPSVLRGSLFDLLTEEPAGALDAHQRFRQALVEYLRVLHGCPGGPATEVEELPLPAATADTVVEQQEHEIWNLASHDNEEVIVISDVHQQQIRGRIDALREAARHAEEAANLLETRDLYEQADALRASAAQLRADARAAQLGCCNETSVVPSEAHRPAASQFSPFQR